MLMASVDDLGKAVQGLVAVEPRFATVVARQGLPALRPMPPGLRSLLIIVTQQLISLSAAAAIWQRVEIGIGEITPETVAASSVAEFMALGLTRAKATCFLHVARACQTGVLNFTGLGECSDDDALAVLQSLHGIGPWTANIYVLNVLQRADVWPAGDVALQRAVQDVLGLESRPSAQQLIELAQPWRPWRSAAALLLWQHYRQLDAMGAAKKRSSQN